MKQQISEIRLHYRVSERVFEYQKTKMFNRFVTVFISKTVETIFMYSNHFHIIDVRIRSI